ncbi:LLM class flavin-dependent oxidoreductase [Antribacter sp. KLBMP9083]|uniref:LLM class flavin-dependent oxidoreductase n=1 Tax=Antribacter soli TaxID=2910976 RepID=A0AA41U6Y8_9MICO|nr:LLM class flavin-dependent oxidoreductase [Antribacter soli]MCF4120961.1 LLM class flavin-dependent oxidoreductase [Antribacter soli]
MTSTSVPRPHDRLHESRSRTVHLGVDLSDAGARPAVWRAVGSQAQRLFDPQRLVELVATARRGRLDLVTFDDAFSLQPVRRGAQGRLDAALVAARVAPRSSGIGLVPTVDTTHTEPFHVSKAITTIDHVSEGRAAWQVGRSTAAEAIDVVSKLWDAGENDAGSRDVRAGRLADDVTLDHEGVRFVKKVPSIAPRSPQGRPPVVIRVTSPEALDLAARRADVVRVRATSLGEAAALRTEILDRAEAAGRGRSELRVLVEAFVVIGDDARSAHARLDLLEQLDGATWDTDSLIHAGTAQALSALVAEWVLLGAADGFLLRPASLTTDLTAIVDRTVPLLQEAGLFRTEYPGTTLRETLGLPRPASRYATLPARAAATA